MAKLIFDSLTGTVLDLHAGIYIVDTDELGDRVTEALSDGDVDAQDFAKSLGARLTNILSLAGQES